jgi:hypothetical protein
MDNALDGTWEMISGPPLPPGARNIKILAGGHFMFTAYDTRSGEPLYSAGGTCKLEGSTYSEHVDFASEKIAGGLVGKDQIFTVEINGHTFTQSGTLSNGKALTETWKRIG